MQASTPLTHARNSPGSSPEADEGPSAPGCEGQGCDAVVDFPAPEGGDGIHRAHIRARAALERGEIEEALDTLIAAIEVAPDRAALWCDLGRAFHRMGDHPQAQAAYLQALNRQPDHLDTVFHLAELLRASGQLQDALQCASALVERQPDYPGAWHRMGRTLLDLNHLQEARHCFERELARDATQVESAACLAHTLRAQGCPTQALVLCRTALDRHPGDSGLQLNLAAALHDLGEHEQALGCLRVLLAAQPACAEAHQRLILALDASDHASVQAQQSARREWSAACASANPVSGQRAHRKPEASRRLRIGYVSAAFRDTPATRTFAPLLLEYDRSHFEVHCYANHIQEDAVTGRIRASVDGFESIAGMSDEQAAATISAARIDILVDLSGHAEGHRLGVFALRPAPLQITGWGHPHGTALAQMDFVAADSRHLHAGELAPGAERHLNIPATLGYLPFQPLPPVGRLPALSRGFLTFGACLEPGVLSHATVQRWADVLVLLPGSELRLGSTLVPDPAQAQALVARFAATGIDPDRVRVVDIPDWASRVALLGEVDLVLGAESALDAAFMLDGLAMGVPTLALRGDAPPRRLTASLLDAMDLSQDWVAQDTAHWMAQAAHWSARLDVLDSLRAQLRDRLRQSVVGDALRYTRSVESAYRQAWRQTCTSLTQARAMDLIAIRADLAQGRFEAAWVLIEGLLQGDPQDPAVLHLAGITALQLGHQRESVDFLQSALRLDAASADTWIALATALTREERAGAAAYAIEQAARLRTGVGTVR